MNIFCVINHIICVTEKVNGKYKENFMERVIYAVGLGPGAYEMMTLKAKRVLEESDIIFLSGGKVFNGFDEVKKLLNNINCGSKLKFYEYPENKNDRQAYIKHFADETVKHLEKGMKVSYVTMGDMTIYSSFPDIYRELAKHNVILKAVTGISSCFAPASLTGNSIVDWKDKAAIIPCPEDYKEIENILDTFATVIIMKISDNGKVLKTYLDKCVNKPSTAYAVFNAYTERQKIYDLTKEFPYDTKDFFMSVVMIKK